MTDKPAPSAKSDQASAAPARKTAWLTAFASETHGPAGRFLDLTKAEADAAPEGLLVAPTPEQLAQRL